METVNLFGAQRGRAAQAAAWAMEKERFSTQEMANALAVSTPTAITLLRRLEGHGLVQPCGEFSSSGGRKPRAWSACPGARYVVAAHHLVPASHSKTATPQTRTGVSRRYGNRTAEQGNPARLRKALKIATFRLRQVILIGFRR